MTTEGAEAPAVAKKLVDLLSRHGLLRLGVDELIEALTEAQRPDVDLEVEVGRAFVRHAFVDGRQDGPILLESATHRLGERP
jgi:hypothetical protein